MNPAATMNPTDSPAFPAVSIGTSSSISDPVPFVPKSTDSNSDLEEDLDPITEFRKDIEDFYASKPGHGVIAHRFKEYGLNPSEPLPEGYSWVVETPPLVGEECTYEVFPIRKCCLNCEVLADHWTNSDKCPLKGTKRFKQKLYPDKPVYDESLALAEALVKVREKTDEMIESKRSESRLKEKE
ncbi:hypothetical protein OROMI_017700 [Orobanche minor]